MVSAMIRFECDYTEGAHPLIMQKMMETNEEQTRGYGLDEHCENARELIKKWCGREDIDVHFLVGGTQANVTVISSVLRPYQGAVCATSGHINVHETGAMEAYGYKALTIPSTDGKIYAKEVEALCESHFSDPDAEHTVQPGIVYISFPTETGTLYTKQELKELSSVCKKYGIPLFMDGARLGYGLMAQGNDVTIQDICEYTDIFYIGGTKVGALFGEAIVITNPMLKKDFRYYIKQHGGMLAKGRLLGIQFETLFTDHLYEKIAMSADDQALQIRDAFLKKNISFAVDSVTNQQFPVLSYEQAMKLAKDFSFSMNEAELKKGPASVRFCTSWATKKENVDLLLKKIEEL